MTQTDKTDSNGQNHHLGSPETTFVPLEQAAVAMNRILAQMVGKECWSCKAMELSGSVLTFQFGDRIPWASNRSTGKQRFLGEFGLFIEDASWRILRGQEAIMTSDAAMTEDRAIELSVVAISAIKSASISLSTFDLKITFESGLQLDVFCNCFDEARDNYSLISLNDYYVVHFKDRLLAVRLERSENKH